MQAQAKMLTQKQLELAPEPTDEKLRDKMKDTVKEWCSSSTSHGVPNIARNENIFLKLMWAVCFSISAGYCCYSIYISVVDYLDYGTNTQIETVYAYPQEFPAVTLCNLNMFTTQEGVAFSKQVLTRNGITDIVNSALLNTILNYSRLEESVNVYFSTYVVGFNAKVLNNTAKQTLGFPKDNFVLGLVFNNAPLGNDVLRWYFHYNFGNCFQFNTGYDENGNSLSILSTSKTGLVNGLRLFLFVGSQSDINGMSFFNGARVFIHNRTQEPTVTDGITAGAGTATEFVISKTTQTFLPQPYNQCYEDLNSPDQFDSFFYKKVFDSSSTYRQSDCLDLCTQDYIIKACHCADPTWPNLYNTTYCSSVFDTICAFTTRNSLYSQGIATFNTFYNYCPLECSVDTYTITTSFADFPTDLYAELLMNNTNVIANLASIGKPVTMENIKKNFVWLNIYYDRNTYTAISETPQMLITDLMSNIGGTMGLYIGISFLSFVELIEIVLQLGILVCSHSSKAKVSNYGRPQTFP